MSRPQGTYTRAADESGPPRSPTRMSGGRHYNRGPADVDNRFAPRGDSTQSHHAASRYAHQQGSGQSYGSGSSSRDDRYAHSPSGPAVAGPSHAAAGPLQPGSARFAAEAARRYSDYDSRGDTRRLDEPPHRAAPPASGTAPAPPTGPKFAPQPQLERRMNFVDRGAYADLDPPAAQPLPVRDPPPPPREQAPILHARGHQHFARASYQRGGPPSYPTPTPPTYQADSSRREGWDRRPNAGAQFYSGQVQPHDFGSPAFSATGGRPPPPVRPPSPPPQSSLKRDPRRDRGSPSRSPPSSSPRSSATSRSPSPKRRKSAADPTRRGRSISRSPRSPSSNSSIDRTKQRSQGGQARTGVSSDDEERRKRARSDDRAGRTEKKAKMAYELAGRKDVPPPREAAPPREVYPPRDVPPPREPAPSRMMGAPPTGPAANRFAPRGQQPPSSRTGASAYDRPFYPTHASRPAPQLAHPTQQQPQLPHPTVPPPRPQPPPSAQPRSATALVPNAPGAGMPIPTGPRALRDRAAPTGPRAFREPRDEPPPPAATSQPPPPAQPPSTLPSLSAYEIPKGPKQKIVPLKAPTKPVAPPTGPRVLAGNVKKFFGDDEEEEAAAQLKRAEASRRSELLGDAERAVARPSLPSNPFDNRDRGRPKEDDRRNLDRSADRRRGDRELTADEREAWARYDEEQRLLARTGETHDRERERDRPRENGHFSTRYEERPSRHDESRPHTPASVPRSPAPSRYALDPRDPRNAESAYSGSPALPDAALPSTGTSVARAQGPPSRPRTPASIRDARDPRDVRNSDLRDLEVAGGPPAISDPSPMVLESRPSSSLAITADPSCRGSPTANADGTTPALPPPPPGTTELYERLVQVGEGTYGKVYKARNVETNTLVAMKRIRMEAEKDGFPVTAVREIKLLQSLRHPNVVDLIEMMVSKGHVYMVFEYMDHDLTGVLHHPTISFSPAHLKSLMKQFLEGLGFIHRCGVLHRDLKGSNILIGKHGELKIADFGLARFYARGRKNDYTNRVITQWYKPPELLFGATVYGAEVDMWSAGCIFLELFARRPVFQGQDEIHQLEVIFRMTGTPKEETWPTLTDLPWYELVKPKEVIESKLRESFLKWLTPAGLDLAEALLSLNPAGRPDADAALRMPYFTTEEPRPEMPDVLLTVKGEWHEYESKKARRKERG